MKRLTFAMLTTFFPPYNFGGDGIVVYHLANALARDGHRVHVLFNPDAFAALGGHPSPATSYPYHSNVEVHPLGLGWLGAAEMLAAHQLGRPVFNGPRIGQLLDRLKPDVVHFHNVSLLGGPEVLSLGRGLKLCTLHDHWFVCPMHVLWRFNREACTQRTCLPCTLQGRRPLQLWRYTGAVERATRHVDTFIASSEFARESHLRNGFTAPIRVIPLFLPDDGALTSADRPLSLPLVTGNYFLFVGRLEKIKGAQVLIEHFQHYRKADLVLAGTGQYEDELRRLAAGLGHIHFLGRVEHDRLQALYREAIAVLVPSLCYETFGLVPVEAFRAGAAVIAHDLGALSGIVQQARAGFTYRTPEELHLAIETLRTQPGVRREMGERGLRSYREHYTVGTHVDAYYALIAELQHRRSLQEVSR